MTPEPWIYLAYHKLYFEKEIIAKIYTKGAEFYPALISTAMLKNLNLFIKNTKEPYWVFGYGILTNRNQDLMRIGVCDFRKIGEIAEYLQEISWPGNKEHFIKSLEFMDAFSDSFVLALDFNESIQLRVGVECVIDKKDQPNSAEKMLSAIQSRLTYSEERLKAALNWIGTHNISDNEGRVFQQTQWLNHIKLRYDGSDTLEIKPYFYYDVRD